MIETEKFNTRVTRLEELLQEKLSVRGKTLRARFARAGRRLPRRVQKAGRVITDAQANSDHPKLSRLSDPKAVDSAFREVTAHLKTIDPADRRKGAILSLLGSLVFNLLLLVAALIILLHWQSVI